MSFLISSIFILLQVLKPFRSSHTVQEDFNRGRGADSSEDPHSEGSQYEREALLGSGEIGIEFSYHGERGFGASKRNSKGRSGSISDYCVHHCVCPVVVVRFPDNKDGSSNDSGEVTPEEKTEGDLLCSLVHKDELNCNVVSMIPEETEKTS